MESVSRDQLLRRLESQGVLSNQQHGFTKHRSCLTNLLETFESWTRLIDEGFGVDVIYLDYSKAFDTVPHRRLLQKLADYGITGNVLRWIEEYLTGRKMRVRVRGHESSWVLVRSGVPQGSVLGPLLFLLYVNELPTWIRSSIAMFADDTKIWRKISKAEDATLRCRRT